MAKKLSRAARWTDAVNRARIALDEGTQKMEDLKAEIQMALEGPLSDLQDLKNEAEEWFNNMPESLQSGATGERLTEITNLDLPEEVDLDDIDELEEAISNAEGLEFPRGFGRD
jgi:hypothetical protein